MERSLSQAQARKTADAYLSEGSFLDALDFLEKVGDTEGLAELRQSAIESGDLFLLRAVARAMEQAPARAEWLALAEAAEAAGKEHYASDARQQAERVED